MIDTGRPRFRGIRTYRDPQGRFSLRHPSDWERHDLEGDLDGIMMNPTRGRTPDTDLEGTYLGIWATRLETKVVAEDQDILREGVDTGLAQLPDCEVIESKDGFYSNLLKFERIYTFREGDKTRQRRVWILYVDTWQLVLVFQGADPDEFAYWRPMGNYAFATFELPEALWFATDRDLAGVGNSGTGGTGND